MRAKWRSTGRVASAPVMGGAPSAGAVVGMECRSHSGKTQQFKYTKAPNLQKILQVLKRLKAFEMTQQNDLSKPTHLKNRC